jgi:hypothetical protein
VRLLVSASLAVSPRRRRAATLVKIVVDDGRCDMAWSWRYEDADGAPMSGPTETFSSQSDAESWMGQIWRELAAAGVAAVVLLEDDRVEYRMSLLPTTR